MKNLILILILLLPLRSFAAEDYFAEARIGLADSYQKVAQHATDGELSGTFNGLNYGLRLGYTFSSQDIFFEFNPTQNVEIKSVNELAKVNSYFLGYRNFITPEIYLGGQVGHSSFELVQGAGGVTFADNPTTTGLTYGLNVGYKFPTSGAFYIGGELAYNVGRYKADGPASNSVESIEITGQYQLNFNLGYAF